MLGGITAIGLALSCSSTGKMDRLEYYFNQDQQQRKLVMKVPAGYLHERIERLDKDIQVRSFEYPDGARLYLACRDLASQPNILLDARPGVADHLFSRFGAEGSGLKPDGRRWSRCYRSGFLIGYESVTPQQLETYEQAIHSARLAH